MANRKTELERKVAAMQECLTLRDVTTTMQRYGFSERSAWNWLARIREALPELLADQKPGPKPREEARPPFGKAPFAKPD